jgi:iron complex transport system ATP-binding protein
MTSDAAVLLETRAFTLRTAARVLVRRLDWQVARGERWCVIGRNGAGKSLVLRALAGLAVPRREGEILWQGRAQSAWPADVAATFRAYMPQQSQDRFGLTVARVLALSRTDAPRDHDDPGSPGASVAGLLHALDIAALAERRVDQLSGGERQRVALAQCALQGASLMLLDEPVSFQDPAHQQRVARWLAGAEASRPRGFATRSTDPAAGAWIASAHDPSWIARIATHVLALWGDGEWRAGPASEVLTAGVLGRTYGCRWRSVEGAWLPE